MRVIYKFPIAYQAQQIIIGPIVRLISAGLDPQGLLCVWAECEENGITQQFEIQLFGTGQYIPNDTGRFLNTVVDGRFIWHIYCSED